MQTENYTISYRYIPGSIGDHSSLDNGACMTVARRTLASAQKKFAELQADDRIQWVSISKRNHGTIVRWSSGRQ